MSETAIHSFQGRFGRVALHRAVDPSPAHTHPQLHILLKIDGGDGRYRTENGAAALTDRAAVLINPWCAHSRDGAADGQACLYLALYIEPSWLGRPAIGLAETGYPPEIFAKPEQALDDEVCAARDGLAQLLLARRERDEGERDDDAALEEPLFALLALLLARCVGGAHLPRGVRPIDQRIRRAIVVMREALSKDPGVDAIAVSAGLSRSRFFEQFRDCCGMTPRHYADTLLLEEAVRRLTEDDAPIAEISDQLGFSAQSHFTRFFRNKTGVSPSAYRRGARPWRTRRDRGLETLLTATQ
ncbi:MAG: AraC family transcriptional regulator [Marivibrio sp.]|uniref:helix-turn-helix domain-containing protein n=1 Tax=Marivibrio sp. TaxID=2039719 RepID=UPI0032EFB69D